MRATGATLTVSSMLVSIGNSLTLYKRTQKMMATSQNVEINEVLDRYSSFLLCKLDLVVGAPRTARSSRGDCRRRDIWMRCRSETYQSSGAGLEKADDRSTLPVAFIGPAWLVP